MNHKAENDNLFAGDEYTEIEIGRMTKGEHEIANRRFHAFLEQEQGECEQLKREFADVLDQLFALIGKNRADPNADPPGWPEF